MAAGEGSGSARIGYAPDDSDASDAETETDAEPAEAWGIDAARESVCHFLAPPNGQSGRRECLALGDTLVLSERQLRLVCLNTIHETCPRNLRATLVIASDASDRRSGRRPVVLAVAAIAVLVVALLVLRPGLPGFGAAAPASATAARSDALPTSTAAVPSTTSTTEAPTASPTVRPSATARVSSPPSPNQTPSWPPGATASRMGLVRPCTDAPNCYLYTVRANDRLSAIATYFGVPRAAILAMNPEIASPDNIHLGQIIRIPPPTR